MVAFVKIGDVLVNPEQVVSIRQGGSATFVRTSDGASLPVLLEDESYTSVVQRITGAGGQDMRAEVFNRYRSLADQGELLKRWTGRLEEVVQNGHRTPSAFGRAVYTAVTEENERLAEVAAAHKARVQLHHDAAELNTPAHLQKAIHERDRRLRRLEHKLTVRSARLGAARKQLLVVREDRDKWRDKANLRERELERLLKKYHEVLFELLEVRAEAPKQEFGR